MALGMQKPTTGRVQGHAHSSRGRIRPCITPVARSWLGRSCTRLRAHGSNSHGPQPHDLGNGSIGKEGMHQHAPHGTSSNDVSSNGTNHLSAARRLYDAALTDPLHDLSLDFDKTYLNCRCHISVPVCLDEPAAATSTAGAAAAEDPTAGSSSGSLVTNGTAAAAANQEGSQLDGMMAGFQAYLQYQQLVSPHSSSAAAAAAASGIPAEPGDSAQHLDQSSQQQWQQRRQHGNLNGSSTAVDSSSGSSSSIDLLHCAVLIARHAYPSADLPRIKAVIADLGAQAAAVAAANDAGAAAASGSGAGGSRVRALAAAVSHVLYEVQGFTGAVDDFYSPDKQCINRLLETKQGSPALLALLYKLVAAAAGLTLTPLTLPGHTFLQPLIPTHGSSSSSSDGSSSGGSINGSSSSGSDGGVSWSAAPYLIDPFNAGQVCSSSVVEARINACWGYPGQALALNPQHITAAASNGTNGGSSGSASSSGSTNGSSNGSCSKLADGDAGGGVGWRGDLALLVRLLKNLREAYYSPLPLSGRIRWAVNQRLSAPNSSSSSREAVGAPGDAAAAAAGSSSSSSDDEAEAVAAAAAGGRELLHGALAVVRYHRATAPNEVRLCRDEGYILHLLGRTAEGRTLLQHYLAAAPAAADTHRVQEFVVADWPPPLF